MAVRVVEMSQEPRRAQFAYFRAFADPYVGLTVQVDVTDALAWARQTGSGFFLTVLYAAVRAANAVPELRRRIRGETVVEYDQCPSSHTEALADGTYGYCRLTAEGPLASFLRRGAEAQRQAREAPSLEDGEDGEGLLFISCVPWVSYTALAQPRPSPADSNPRITWGRYVDQGGRTLLPVTLLANHALVDGVHIARFYQELDRQLAAIAAGTA